MRRPLPGAWLLLVFCAALLVRAWTLALVHADPYLSAPKADSLFFLQWAHSINTESFWGRELFVQSPLYAYLLALFLRTTAEPLLAIRLLQVLLGSGACVLVALSAHRLSGDARAALLAGLLAAGYGPLVYYDVLILKESLGVFLIALFLLLVLMAAESGRPRRWALAGLVLGLFWLVRANAPLLALPPLAWLGLQRRGRALPAALAFTAAMLLAVAPLTARNLLVTGKPVLTIASGGWNLYAGNNPQATGLYHAMPGVSADPRREAGTLVAYAERQAGRPLTDAEASDWYVGETLRFVLGQPLQWLRLMLRKALIFWNAFEVPDNYAFSGFVLFLPHLGLMAGFPLAAALGLAGLALPARTPLVRLVRWEVLAYFLSVVLFYVNSRFRVMLVPLLLAGSAPLVAALLEAARQRRASGLLVPAALASVFFALTQSGVCDAETARVDARSWARYGEQLLERGRLAEADRALRRAYALHPADAYANLRLGDLALRTRRPAQAARFYAEARRLGAEDGALLRKSVTALSAAGQRQAAIELLRQALGSQADAAEARKLLRSLGAMDEEAREGSAPGISAPAVEPDGR
jgi:tetratricopeptide (TPR) repeat protein